MVCWSFWIGLAVAVVVVIVVVVILEKMGVFNKVHQVGLRR